MPELTEDQVLERIREELAAIKVPDAESGGERRVILVVPRVARFETFFFDEGQRFVE